MTSGPDRYREAERILRDPYLDAINVVAAQVHATLALAAATTLRMSHEFHEIADDIQEWAEATGAAVLNDQGDDPAHTDGALDRIAGHALAGAYLDQNGGAV